ncbi:hypothetical protein HUE56_30015 (plasmid) [Azospirillum oryzae]|uniref:Uncharacterized protein n=1 Tax=Azospirillum oryzae TaxID=286727 RepID=A0A6N1AU21_9PROT|nr:MULTISPECIES: hypothetical protein [Azospirillum]KAA0584268.1 hypothetical protein FZ938_30245 [Azospirillum oryzae]PWC83337.1 hypothetical protein TSO5_29590 [Azospirillum sp. TSO5]QCG99278.1 hypothetical protein E6C67_36435 [Azospirillum sp. TSA2s]QKS54738.1 hypothetical protein HUE56_30015 [Azospirillum oryzae]GLR83052.1 hypothetical protein GCM10007856_57600 [Azospirillum oryzae]
MSKIEITAGRSYVNKSGRTERLVVEVGHHVPVQWLGSPETEPRGEPAVLYRQVRNGKTVYKEPGEYSMYLSAFRNWAAREA